ncbi:hypothetical protein [Siccirubricoccus sp. G192]|uniref:hypothetical protein n=1 Tax=Siccirubricoccus sp. G192 TaxID=2849651 RepID=UPI001C2BAC09|nr:hypothetical protein [Siccirubricoccus sp. G192]MBV1800441.1 hypothetical protein [Siccirubricoccus sp. G192]
MRPTTAALALLGATLVAAPSASFAQTGSAPAPAARATDTPRPSQPAAPAARRDDRTDTRTPDAPVAGANSFTEGQARSRIEGAGYSNVGELRKDDQGVWRGRASRNGTAADVALDYQGHVVSGAAARGPATGSSATAGGTTAAPSSRDGAPGNPPSTATGRAVDRMQGQTPRPDGNPPGTAAGRAVDRTLGTNSTGANPQGQGTTSGGTPTR